MDWSLVTWMLAGAGTLAGLGLLQVLWLAAVLAWEDRATVRGGYYGRSADGRHRFRRTLRGHARALQPVLRLMERVTAFSFERASFEVRGVAGPRGSCDPESFQRGAAYRPGPDDVFVTTQMRSGTTWMLHLIYEALHRGEGDLVGQGEALHGVVPWLESRKTRPVAEAPLLGAERPSRLIKTHFPVELCPFDEDARYVYVVRHPVACFASCVDFLEANAGAMAPGAEEVAGWFCSDEMWWGPWPDHVEGWWARGRGADNVLFVGFEEMKRDLAEVARRVADFLGLEPLEDGEMERVLRRCSYEYMERHSETFEMQPPHLLSVDSEFFQRGTVDRHRDVPDDLRRRVAAWCADRMKDGSYPLGETFPDVAGAAS